MIQKRKNKHRSNRTILRLPDLDHSKTSVLQSLGPAASNERMERPSKTSSRGTADPSAKQRYGM